MRAPDFWRTDGLAAWLLAPVGAAVAAVGERRRRRTVPWRAPVPVLCVGNLTAGGAGKTPTALALAALLAPRRVAFLTRGYGGREPGPLWVDPLRHDAGAVGDEALLLAAAAPTVVARDRPAGARLAVERADLIVMDDGFQNPSLAKDASLLVVDGEAGHGNGRLIPAGPLRERPGPGFRRASALVLIGPDRHGVAAAAELPVLPATLEPVGTLPDGPLVAFAGIGRPEKFFASLRARGAGLAATVAFADHHRYRPADLARLRALAERHGARLVTTAKDRVRLPPAADVAVAEIRLRFADPEAVRVLLP